MAHLGTATHDPPTRRSCSKNSNRSGNFISRQRSSCDSAVFFRAPDPLKPSKPSEVVGRDGVGAEGLRTWSLSEGCRISPPKDLMGIDCAGNLISSKSCSLKPKYFSRFCTLKCHIMHVILQLTSYYHRP